MMKLFRVHHVHANGLETLALTASAGGLKSAVKRVRGGMTAAVEEPIWKTNI